MRTGSCCLQLMHASCPSPELFPDYRIMTPLNSLYPAPGQPSPAHTTGGCKAWQDGPHHSGQHASCCCLSLCTLPDYRHHQLALPHLLPLPTSPLKAATWCSRDDPIVVLDSICVAAACHSVFHFLTITPRLTPTTLCLHNRQLPRVARRTHSFWTALVLLQPLVDEPATLGTTSTPSRRSSSQRWVVCRAGFGVGG